MFSHEVPLNHAAIQACPDKALSMERLVEFNANCGDLDGVVFWCDAIEGAGFFSMAVESAGEPDLRRVKS